MRRIAVCLFPMFLALATNARANDTCPTAVQRQNSSSHIVVHPRIHNIYLGSDYWDGGGWSQRAYLDGAFEFLSGQPMYWSRLGEYGVQSGAWGGSFTAAASWTSSSGNYDDSWFESEINLAINNGLGFYDDGNDLYVVYLPPGVHSTSSLKDGVPFWGGYHSAYNDYYGRRIYFAVIEPDQGYSAVALVGHEIAEAATDPDGDGYYQSRSPWSEIGDLCETGYGSSSAGRYTFTWPGSSYVVEALFSELACTCITTALPPASDPCAGLTGTARTCCERPSLPMCNA